MKMFRFVLLMLASVGMAAAMGCSNSDPVETDTNPQTSDDADGGTKDSEMGDINFITAECDESKICATLSKENAEDCVATFGLGTAQAGSEAIGYENHVGVYGYNDRTHDSIPAINNDDSEDAYLANRTCESAYKGSSGGDHVLHVSGTGFTEWGFGIGVDWGGPNNPDCYDEDGNEIPGGMECLEVFEEDSNFKITTAEADPRCQDEDGNPDPSKMRCAIWVKKYKVPRDLSMYKGIGFWVARHDPDSLTKFQINFGIPETTRFYMDGGLKEEYRRVEGVGPAMTYEGGCTIDDGEKTHECYNDFAYVFSLPTKLDTWSYVEVDFDLLNWSEYWGLKLEQYDSFPASKNIGIKFQTPSDGTEPDEYFDFYIDDIRFVRR